MPEDSTSEADATPAAATPAEVTPAEVTPSGETHDGEAHDGEAHDGEAHDGEAHDGEAHDEETRGGGTLLDQLESRHQRVLDELDALNRQIEGVLAEYQQGRRQAVTQGAG